MDLTFFFPGVPFLFPGLQWTLGVSLLNFKENALNLLTLHIRKTFGFVFLLFQ